MSENTMQAYGQYVQEEAQRIEEYINTIYVIRVPRPVPPKEEELDFWKIVGLESSLFVLSGVGAAILSSIRTGGLFLLLEVLLIQKYGLPALTGNIFGVIALITSLLAFEGFLLAYGLTVGKESGKLKVSKTGMIICMITVITAGIFSSFGLIELGETLELWFNIIMALITATTSSLVALFSAENVGFILNHYASKKNDILSQHQADDTKWYEGAINSYNTAKKNILKNLGTIGDIVEASQKQIPQEQPKKKTKVEIAYEFVKEYYFQNKAIPTNQVVSDGTGVSIGTCYEAINNFIIDNEVELVENRVVTFEDVEKIKVKKFEKDPKYKQLSSFVRDSQRFPNESEIASMEIPISTVFQFIKFEEQTIRENNWLDEETIQQALRSEN